MDWDKCWICGTNKNITKHHVLNRCLKPIANLEIPLCDRCHKFLHLEQLSHLKNKRLLGKYLHATSRKNVSREELQRIVTSLYSELAKAESKHKIRKVKGTHHIYDYLTKNYQPTGIRW